MTTDGPQPRDAPRAPAGEDDPGARLADGVNRRHFLRTAGLGAAAAAAGGAGASATTGSVAGAGVEPTTPTIGPDPVPVRMRVNGTEVAPEVEPATTLLEALRIDLDLTGTKQVCDRGACGGCTVLVDGEPVASCMMLAHDAQDRVVRTIEGLRRADGSLDPLQEAFVRFDALQCGYCTPGFVMAAKALLDANPTPTLDEIKIALAGNICRCGTYTNIFDAVLVASGQQPIGGGEVVR